MKRYNLICPKCLKEEVVMLKANDPEELWCEECNENLDLDEIRGFIAEWSEYIKDLDELLAKEQEEQEEQKK